MTAHSASFLIRTSPVMARSWARDSRTCCAMVLWPCGRASPSVSWRFPTTYPRINQGKSIPTSSSMTRRTSPNWQRGSICFGLLRKGRANAPLPRKSRKPSRRPANCWRLSRMVPSGTGTSPNFPRLTATRQPGDRHSTPPWQRSRSNLWPEARKLASSPSKSMGSSSRMAAISASTRKATRCSGRTSP